MMNTVDSDALNMTLLSVCVSEDIVSAALDVAMERQWTVTRASFDSYISSRRRPHFPDALKAGDGCIALIDFEKDPDQAAEAAAFLRQVFPGHLGIMAVSGKAEMPYMLAAMRAGCTEFLNLPLAPQTLHNAFHGVEQQLAARTSTPQTAGTVLSMLGAKGGVGTTTLGVHLAIYLSQNNKKKVLLIDSKPQFGHVCIYLGADGSSCHFQELVSNVNRLDSELLKSFVSKHPSGVELLSSPDVGQIARQMFREEVVPTLEFLRGEYDFVIVDCDNLADDLTRAIVTASSQVYLVATPDITAIRDLSRHVDDLARMDSAIDVRVVINRYSSQFAVSLEEIEKAIRLPVSFSIPNNYIELVRSANLGVPVSADGKSGFTIEITKWAQSLVGLVEEKLSVKVPTTKSHPWASLKQLVSSIGTRAQAVEKRA
ncbi:AAA family ATPase [Granulicella sibirica]|uniref:Type II/IV secretion system ATPase TadZ/CpaE, associated with Flp pilus assembly n=1 Tax=Granulicella sibirica TaxID=2479048 RepID=A0A4Q0T343_9BACT|nr:AAA family ATPase [Granulicella sibirica]RXH58003.1 Type II/IV secretion system ATPase TadZ/CpaE, associated with Flp pilus assembly [Granulicella sibirica]